MSGIATEHKQVLKTLFDCGHLSRQAMKTIRGQVLKMQDYQERELYLKKVISNIGESNRGRVM